MTGSHASNAGFDSFESRQSVDHLLISRILFNDFDEGEFFTIYNPTESNFDLSNWSVTDGEGELIIPESTMLVSKMQITIARNAHSYLSQNGELPDYSILPNEVGIDLVHQKGSFRLNNKGDELTLINDDNAVDAVLFGGSAETDGFKEKWDGPPIPSPGRGRILQRNTLEGGVIDTDTNSEWLALRDYRPGQHTFSVIDANAALVPLILPEHSNLILQRLYDAKKSVLVCSHKFDSQQIFTALALIASRGVDVELLLEGAPPGGLSEKSQMMLSLLGEYEVDAWLMENLDQGNNVRRYPVLHSKYFVVDDDISILLSENLVEDVFDMPLGRGNRGWGVIIESPQTAAALKELFISDKQLEFRDVAPFETSQQTFNSEYSMIYLNSSPPDRKCPSPPKVQQRSIRLHIFPEPVRRGSAILDLIDNARESIYVEIFYAQLFWDSWAYGRLVNPVIDLLVDKNEGVQEFVMCFDNSWISDIDGRNREVMDFILKSVGSNAPKTVIGYPKPGAPFEMIHNKGMVIDHRFSWISSINWNSASMFSNREVGLLIDSPEIARFFERNILTDLFGDNRSPVIRAELRLTGSGAGWTVEVSNDSDDSGLKSALLRTSDGRKGEWYIAVNPSMKSTLLEIEAVDLWDNRATVRILLFPSGDMEFDKPFGMLSNTGFGILLSMTSLFFIIAIQWPFFRTGLAAILFRLRKL